MKVVKSVFWTNDELEKFAHVGDMIDVGRKTLLCASNKWIQIPMNTAKKTQVHLTHK